MPALISPMEDADFGDWLLTLPAFYAEFVPRDRHAESLDHLYLIRDCGAITAAGQNLFASPFSQVCFAFRQNSDGAGVAPTVVTVQPNFGSRKRKRPFHEWALGLRSYPSSSFCLAQNHAALSSCSAKLARSRLTEVSWTTLLETLDGVVDELLEATRKFAPSHEIRRLLDRSEIERGMTRLAPAVEQSARTLQRRVRRSTGLSPKQFLTVERFDRAVRTVATPKAKLSNVAYDLRFSDQAHLTREFRRHAGRSPGAFRDMWQGCPGQTVRFFQDRASSSRLRMAAWVIDM